MHDAYHQRQIRCAFAIVSSYSHSRSDVAVMPIPPHCKTDNADCNIRVHVPAEANKANQTARLWRHTLDSDDHLIGRTLGARAMDPSGSDKKSRRALQS